MNAVHCPCHGLLYEPHLEDRLYTLCIVRIMVHPTNHIWRIGNLHLPVTVHPMNHI